MDVNLGQVVHSIAGRDKGKYYMVIKKLDERFVLVADGHTRPLSKPKRKNLRHLQPHNKQSFEIRKKLQCGNLTDVELMQALKALTSGEFGERGKEA